MKTTTPKQKRPPRERIPQSDVLAWLQANHPGMHRDAEIERAWVWIAQSPADPSAIKSIEDYGFVRSRKGGHPLPSGRMGIYGHSCERPLPFKRKFHGPRSAAIQGAAPEPKTVTETETKKPGDEYESFNGLDAEAMAFAMEN